MEAVPREEGMHRRAGNPPHLFGAFPAGRRRRVVLLAALSLWALVAVSARAQPLPGMLPRRSLPPQVRPTPGRLKVGYWVEYAVRNHEQGQSFRWRVAIVGREGRNRLWWEHLLRFGRTRAIIVKLLVADSTTSKARVLDAIWKPLGHQALRVPVSQGKGLMDLYVPKVRGRAQDRGTELVRVAGGSFRAHRYDVVDNRGRRISFWNSRSVPIFGLVKLLSPALRMELTGYGTSATTMIHEKPGKWPFGPARGR